MARASQPRLPRWAFDSDYEAALSVRAGRERLDAAITALAADSEFTPIVRRLSCLGGISTLTAFALAVELGIWQRFTGISIGAFVGLVTTLLGVARVLPGPRSPVPGRQR